MGCRWVGAALVVVAVISSASLRVEGSFESDVRRIKAAYDKIMSGGKGEGEVCKNDLFGSWDLRKLLNVSGMSEAQMQDYYKAAYPVEEGGGVWVKSYANDLEKFAGRVDEECAVKSLLHCSLNFTCVSCTQVDKGRVDAPTFCEYAKQIVEAHEASNGGGSGGGSGGDSGGGSGGDSGGDSGDGSGGVSGGGWSVRPVDGALVAALLALSALFLLLQLRV